MPAHPRYTILIVSDAGAGPGLLASFLRSPDIRVLHSPEPARAFDTLGDRRPELIIEDLEREAAAGFRERVAADARTRGVPSIVVTGGDPRSVERGSGPTVVLKKPIVQREYFDTVTRFVPLPRRRALRHDVNLRFRYTDPDGTHHAFSRDLSAYGAFLKTDRLLEEGTHIDLRFQIPGDPREIRCGGIVRQVAPVSVEAMKITGFGFEFEGIDDSDLERLQRFIEADSRAALFQR